MYKGVDLHCHLEGCVPIKALNKIRQDNGKEILVHKNLNGLSEFSKYFGEVSRSLTKESDFETATREFLLAQHKAGVVYCEFRVAPYHHIVLGGKDFSKILSYVKNGIDQAYSACGIIGKIIIESARQYGEEQINQVFDWTLKYYDNDYIVGFGIGGVEMDGDFKNFDNTLGMCEKYNIPVSLHAGENGSVCNLLYALENPIVKRIGHALSFGKINDKDKSKYNKLIEICISSNEHLSKNFIQHPVKEMYEHKVPIAISTDDSMIFDTDFQKESNKLGMILNLDDSQINNINRNAISFAFCDNNIKQQILKLLSGTD